MEKISYGGWDNCFKLFNDKIELIVTADVGPRIIRFGFLGRENMFKEFPDQMGKTKSSEWLSFGGHRLWHAPEAQPRTYFPDLDPVHVQEIENGMILTQKPEPTTGLQKQIEIKISQEKAEVHLKHILINHNLWAVETAPWAITVLAPGGVAILPLPPRGPHPEYILPTTALALWPYTNLSDPRWVLGKQYILLRQDVEVSAPQKIGLFASDGWAAYANQNCLFVKQIPLQFEGIYPDMGVNFETFTNETMLELESLGPIQSIPPKGQIDHMENWTLIDDVPTPGSETEVIENLEPLL